MKHKIFITGGHLTPALSVIQALDRNKWQIFYIGRKYALEGDSALSQEWILLNKSKDINFLTLVTGRIQRSITRYFIFSICKIPLGFFIGGYYILRYRPHIILTFGGYVAIPIVFWAVLLRIPVVLHEQTRRIGLANSLTAHFARKVCVSWPDMQKIYPGNKVIMTGNPVRMEIFEVKDVISLEGVKPLLYITGGSLGAHSLNVVICEGLKDLLNEYEIIWQTGNSLETRDFQRARGSVGRIKSDLKKRIHIYEYIPSTLIGFVFKNARIVVTRSGANILTELMAMEKLALFIPLPWSGGGEQLANANLLVDKHAAEMILQENFTVQKLKLTLQELQENPVVYLDNVKKIKQKYYKPNAASSIVQVVNSLV